MIPTQRTPRLRAQREEVLIRSLVIVSALLLLVFCSAPDARTQQDNNPAPRASDLAQQNMSQVAAGAPEIKAVLIKDIGLMVELKRWVAKDATDHGQIVGESDLSDDAILNRLETDVQFRSVATALLQKYGYLVPKLNPDSEAGKQEELLTVERTKWIAQAEEEQRAQAQQKAAQDLQKTAVCNSDRDNACNGASSQAPRQNPGQNRQIGTLPLTVAPPDQDIPNTSGGGSGSLLQRAQLVQMGGSTDGLSTGSLTSGSFDNANLPAGNGSPSSLSSFSGGVDTGANQQISSSVNGSGFGASGLPDGSTDGSERGVGPRVGAENSLGMGTDLSDALLGGSEQTNGSLSSGSGPSLLVPMQPNSRYPAISSLQPTEMVRKSSPYAGVPSLVDMYMQSVAQPVTPRRFGAEIFENGTRDLELIPMDLPAGPDYVVGPGDGLSIDLWGGVSERLLRTVDREGQISLPEIGPVLVSGKSLTTVQEDLQQILRGQYRNVSAGVSLSRLRTIRIYEVGDVVNPGAYDISSLSTPLNALFIAGGPSARGSMRIVKHYRGDQLLQTVDLYDLLLHGVKTNIERLENGDTVQIPPVGAQVTIEGMVRRPAVYELRDEKTLASVLDLAGGVLPAAALRHIEVQRLVAHDKQTMLSLDIPETADNAEVTKKLESFEIQDGDRIRIYPIAPYNQDAIYLDGHVVRPGRYSYHKDMRVTDILASYKDMLPEPATQYAEIIRLNAPDFRPSIESFNLGDALADPSKAPALQPMDTIRIFSRFDFENPPEIAVLGEVRQPGAYKTAGQVRLADAVHLAGGLTPDAQTTDAQVFRYLPDGKFKIFSVSLGQALAGDATENIMLEPRDRLLVHRNPDSVEGATVYVQGDVTKPGRYPLTTNMHVADLIRVGGGLKPSADASMADLTEYEWLNGAKLSGQQEQIPISAALSGDEKANVTLSNGDVLTIRQLPGWSDLGAYITLKGEVKNPGTYGIRPGEKLSSVVERAGGFQPDAYPFGAVLERDQVRELERSAQATLIIRAESVESGITMMPDTDPKQKQAKETAMQQYQTTLAQLNANPPSGRLTVRISSGINRWKNTAADIEVRAGDVMIVPKKPSYVMVTGQVFDPTAIGFRPGKSAAWYLSQAGGATLLGDKKAAFVIRADGSVIGERKGVWDGNSFESALEPGDTVVVPERAIGGTVQWQTVFSAAQVATSVATSIFIATHY
jgi:polysaccharide biosynthesis/export protein